jgi:hypothetical protein
MSFSRGPSPSTFPFFPLVPPDRSTWPPVQSDLERAALEEQGSDRTT